MVVSVQMGKIFPKQISGGWPQQFEVTLLPGSTLADLILDLGVNLPLEALLLLVNDQAAEPNQILIDGDQVKLMPTDLQESSKN